MRYLKADIIYPLYCPPIKNGVIVVDNMGEIKDILSCDKGLINIEYYKGILCPGFVNTHCHLELSHLSGKIPKNTKLPSFLHQISKNRTLTDVDVKKYIQKANLEMRKNGIVAVGDISNTSLTFEIKKTSEIYYHTFIEIFSLDKRKAEEVYSSALSLKKKCSTKSSIVPHATYSVSEELFNIISKNNNGEIICIHNQETKSEDEHFSKNSGDLNFYLNKYAKNEYKETSALKFAVNRMPNCSTMLVHNTYTSSEDVKWATKNISDLYWCTCPQANIYIEDKLPDYNLFLNSKMTIGTDSLASNDTLSIWSEIKTLKKHTKIDLNTLLTWGCKNGAEFLKMDHLGTFEKGKRPGVNNIFNSKINVLF